MSSSLKTEFEITFAKITISEVKDKIEKLNWICLHPRRLMKRVVFDNPNKNSSYMRIRDEWNKITCTYKEVDKTQLSINSVKELECEVSNFDIMYEIFTSMGIISKAYQETYREERQINNEVLLMIDERPWLSPILEIEGENEEIVRKYTKLLWYKREDGIFGTIDEVYHQEIWCPNDWINCLPIITFDEPPVYNK